MYSLCIDKQKAGTYSICYAKLDMGVILVRIVSTL